ncbi:ATP-binding cassette domain-containing protein [Piscirickettsia litoralis]|uniref:ABC transporter domain-containing protein n=1 Tax=Piscirickettsia litoralis TaxID=1891921 RepID=A0ABX3A4W6_9GAMM|nr:ABC transporter ATP-binding protein [Piscirickettsia litoralis]ODN42475.1 hypothetical protein BGC07_05455 [Piscirickettsia litoralis]
MIQINNVSKSFDHGASYAVNQVTLDVTPSECLVILGTSGSGKTTLLKMITGLLPLTSGEIRFKETKISEISKTAMNEKIGFVFQHSGLFPHMTVFDNIALPLKISGKNKSFQIQRAEELINSVELDNSYLSRYPDELSGGQKQRINIARALAMNPDCLLMDEPFSALDAITRHSLHNEVKHLRSKFNKTIIFITHNIFEAFILADRIAIMHQGKLEQLDTPSEIVRKPASDFVNDYITQAFQPLQQNAHFLGDNNV